MMLGHYRFEFMDVLRTMPQTGRVIDLAELKRQIGAAIRAKRVSLLIPPQLLARTAGLSVDYLKRIEDGQANSTLFELHKLSRALKMDFAEMVRGLV